MYFDDFVNIHSLDVKFWCSWHLFWPRIFCISVVWKIIVHAGLCIYHSEPLMFYGNPKKDYWHSKKYSHFIPLYWIFATNVIMTDLIFYDISCCMYLCMWVVFACFFSFYFWHWLFCNLKMFNKILFHQYFYLLIFFIVLTTFFFSLSSVWYVASNLICINIYLSQYCSLNNLGCTIRNQRKFVLM